MKRTPIAIVSTKLSWLHILVITLLLLGIFFRFFNLDGKVYWADETVTSLWMSGSSIQDVIQSLYTQQVITVEDLRGYQRINAETSVLDVIRNLADEDPQHPPLYYSLLRLWLGWFGDSISITRSLSAALNLMLFPCAYWLCLELFSSSSAGWMMMGLIAISPMHILFSQEARPYSLWTVTLLLSSTSLLQAIRHPIWRNWGLYTITLILGLYSFLFTVFVMVSHALYVVLVERFHVGKVLRRYCVSSVLAILWFLPWILNIDEINAATWTAKEVPLSYIVKTWIWNISRIFFDVNLDLGDSSWLKFPALIMPLILVGWALLYLLNKTPFRCWGFIVALGVVPALILILPDLILGGQRSTIYRYLIPTWLSIQLMVAYLLSEQISSLRATQVPWRAITVGVLSAGVVSCLAIAQAPTWWTKYADVQLALVINQSTAPLVISDEEFSDVFALGHQLDSATRLLLIPELTDQDIKIPEIPDGFDQVFVFRPSDSLRRSFSERSDFELTPVPGVQGLWRLVSSPSSQVLEKHFAQLVIAYPAQ